MGRSVIGIGKCAYGNITVAFVKRNVEHFTEGFCGVKGVYDRGVHREVEVGVGDFDTLAQVRADNADETMVRWDVHIWS